MSDNLQTSVNAITPELIETRHRLHARPELSGSEGQTAQMVADRLRELGLEVRTGIGGHGVIADLAGAAPGPTLALRADMDALPIREENLFPYTSQNPGVMHACGHDGHTTILLGAASILANRRDQLAGHVRFLFQPAEETVVGAKRLCSDGVMEGVDAIVGLHGWPGLGLGQIGIRSGAMMASADTFEIIIKGRGAHAAYPHLSFDPIVVGAQVVLAFQTIAAREIPPNEPVVVTVGQFQAGSAHNIIPGEARLAGTVRTLSPEVRAAMPERLRRIADGICAASRASCEFSFSEGVPPVMNDPDMTDLIIQAGRQAIGLESVVPVEYPSMGAEDFAVYLQHVPGAMFCLGLGDTAPIHTPTFDFNDGALPVGVEMFVEIARRYFEKPAMRSQNADISPAADNTEGG